jgi:hypothetical protein
MRPAEHIHPDLPPMRLVNRRTEEYVGACPFCGGDAGSDRFHVWMTESGGRPARRFWCRSCGESGLLDKRFGDERDQDEHERIADALRRAEERRATARPQVEPRPEHIPQYRQIYTLVALWAHTWLLDEANPDPLAYIARRGLSAEDAGRHVLGYGLLDPQALVTYLQHEAPELLPYAEESGVLVRDRNGTLRTHWNLCGTLVFPYFANGEIVDIRMRRPGGGHKTKSLPGSSEARGATFPMGWDTLDGDDTVLLTESGEFKALIPQAAYHAGQLTSPTLGHPGLTNFRPEWGYLLAARGVRTVVLAYDSQPRPVQDGVVRLAPEEAAAIRHGQTLAAAGLEVRVLRLPLTPGETKADLDDYQLRYGTRKLQALIDDAPLLYDYHLSLPRPLLERANLPVPSTYPTRRGRPRRVVAERPALRERPMLPGEVLPTGCRVRMDMATGASYVIEPAPAQPAATAPLTLAEARQQIAEQVRDHATSGQGILVLAHPPGAGKGHNTTLGLKAYLQHATEPGRIVWTAIRKDQLHDQQGLQLVPLHGRNPGNCYKFAEAQALSNKGYNVRQALCERRCPHLSYCKYLSQFGQDADFFAPLPLLQATRWWADAGVVVLDEFDPARLTRTVSLSLNDLAAMSRGTDCPHAQAVLHWFAAVLATTLDRTLSGSLLYTELMREAGEEGLDFWDTVQTAIDNLPPPEEQAMLPGFPSKASLMEYEALPPGYLPTLLEQIGREGRKRLSGKRYTSRIEARGGTLQLYLRIDHLIGQLAMPEQPKIILDATANEGLLRAIFPHTPVRVEQPRIAGAMRVIQVISRDWAKSTLRGKRREQWYDEVAAQIRPGRKTLVVCTLDCKEDLQRALTDRGHPEVQLAHYGALRGSNAYQGHDVILAQVYHPNLEQIIREGRALFADDATPLDERIVTAERRLTDATGASWAVQVPTFADSRLAALLESRRENEMVQAALRGRPLDHPDTQITLLFGMPLPGLAPTIISEAPASPKSNAGRQTAARTALQAAAQQLLDGGQRLISVQDLAAHADVSVVTVRTHWQAVADRLHLRSFTQRRMVQLPNGSRRSYARAVLIRRGRTVPRTPPRPATSATGQRGTDQARNHESATRVIRRSPRFPTPPRGGTSRVMVRRRAILTFSPRTARPPELPPAVPTAEPEPHRE